MQIRREREYRGIFGKIGAHWCANAHGTVNFKRIYGVEVSHFFTDIFIRLESYLS